MRRASRRARCGATHNRWAEQRQPPVGSRSTLRPRARGCCGPRRALALNLFAPAALGLVMTVAILPIFIGLPLLLLFGRPWWVSLRVARGRASFGRAARVHLLVASTAWTLGWLGSAVVGFDDLDSTQDTALWALVVLPYSTVMGRNVPCCGRTPGTEVRVRRCQVVPRCIDLAGADRPISSGHNRRGHRPEGAGR